MKKFVITTLLLALMLSLAACGNAPAETTEASETAPTTSPTKTTSVLSSDTPTISSGSGCQPGPEDLTE